MRSIVILSVLIFFCNLYANHKTAASTSYEDCSEMVKGLADGDTGYIPYGVAVWKEPIIIKNKSVHIFGKVKDGKRPVIIDSIPASVTWEHTLFWFDVQPSDTIRVSNLTFYAMISKPYGFIMIRTTKAFRVDHCIFNDSLGEQRAIVAHNGACGVFDKCIVNIRNNKTTQGLSVFGDGDSSWTRPSSYGTSENVFIEDCVFNFEHLNDGAVDAYNGARVVFRNNIVNGTILGWHGFDSGNYRSTFSFEIYNNYFNNNNTSLYIAMGSRGGSAVVWGNIISGNYDRWFILGNYRSCPTVHIGEHEGDNNSTTLYNSSAKFVSENPASNYIYKITTNEWDTVKTKTDTTIVSDIVWNKGDKYVAAYYPMECGFCMGFSPCDGNQSPSDSGYPCRDQIGRGTNQTLSPVYSWNNNFKGDTNPLFINNYHCDRTLLHIKKNRDFYDNTPKPGYKPYVFPHPLRSKDPLNNRFVPRHIRVSLIYN